MAESKEEQFARLHAKFGKKPKADEAEGKDNADEEDKESKPKSKRGRPKKTNADRRADEQESGRRTAGRAGTGDFLGGRSGDRGKPRDKKMLAAPNATRLADKVMAGVGGAGGAASSFMPSPTGPVPSPMQPPMPNGRQQTLTKVLAASGNPPSAPPAGGLFMSPQGGGAPGLVMPRPSLPPLDFQRDVAIPPGYSPGGVGMQGAEAAPRKVKTVDIPAPAAPAGREGSGNRMPTSSAERASGKPRLKPKSDKDRLADRISKDTSGRDDYYEQLKRGQFNLSK